MNIIKILIEIFMVAIIMLMAIPMTFLAYLLICYLHDLVFECITGRHIRRLPKTGEYRVSTKENKYLTKNYKTLLDIYRNKPTR